MSATQVNSGTGSRQPTASNPGELREEQVPTQIRCASAVGEFGHGPIEARFKQVGKSSYGLSFERRYCVLRLWAKGALRNLPYSMFSSKSLGRSSVADTMPISAKDSRKEHKYALVVFSATTVNS
jgi:hypothetical protein